MPRSCIPTFWQAHRSLPWKNQTCPAYHLTRHTSQVFHLPSPHPYRKRPALQILWCRVTLIFPAASSLKLFRTDLLHAPVFLPYFYGSFHSMHNIVSGHFPSLHSDCISDWYLPVKGTSYKLSHTVIPSLFPGILPDNLPQDPDCKSSGRSSSLPGNCRSQVHPPDRAPGKTDFRSLFRQNSLRFSDIRNPVWMVFWYIHKTPVFPARL